jgi:hypothetical protein
MSHVNAGLAAERVNRLHWAIGAYRRLLGLGADPSGLLEDCPDLAEIARRWGAAGLEVGSVPHLDEFVAELIAEEMARPA